MDLLEAEYMSCHHLMVLFFFNDTATTEIYTLSLHDALPIWNPSRGSAENTFCHPAVIVTVTSQASGAAVTQANRPRPILMRIVVPTHNATAASSWFEIPNSGHSELIPPSGSTTP